MAADRLAAAAWIRERAPMLDYLSRGIEAGNHIDGPGRSEAEPRGCPLKITKMAVAHDGSRLLTVESNGAHRVRHEVPVPPGACPVSRNPISGVAIIIYRPAGCVLEVVSITQALAWATGGGDGAPRSVEQLAAWLARECMVSLGVAVAVRVDLQINPGPQRIVADHAAVLPRNA